MIVAVGGAKAAFVANALSSYFAVHISSCGAWKPEPALPVERRPLLAVIGEGFRYAMGSPPVRTIMLRAVIFTATGSAAWALMPLVAADLLGQGSVIIGLLLGALGLGAVFGAATSTWFRRLYSSEAIIRAAGMLYGVGIHRLPLKPGLPAMLALLVVSGAGLGAGAGGFSVAGQMWSPRPLVGRITAMVSSLSHLAELRSAAGSGAFRRRSWRGGCAVSP